MKKLFELLNQYFNPERPPVVLFETDRLIVRMYKKEDVDDLLEFASMPATTQYDFHSPYKRKDAENEIQLNLQKEPNLVNNHNTYAIELKGVGKMIGTISCSIEEKNILKKQARIGYTIHPNYQQQGYAYETCRAFLDHLFQQDIHRVSAGCFTENVASWRLLEKLGMRREAHHRKVYFVKGRYWDNFEYAILEEEWEEV